MNLREESDERIFPGEKKGAGYFIRVIGAGDYVRSRAEAGRSGPAERIDSFYPCRENAYKKFRPGLIAAAVY